MMHAELLTPAQNELSLTRRPNAATVPFELIARQNSAGAAFTLACATSGLDDKEIYMSLIKADGKHVDSGYFSNMKKGDATLHGDLIAPFCRIVGNTIYPAWIAYQVGCGLVMLKSEAERRAEAAERERDEALSQNRLMRELIAGRSVRGEGAA